MRNHSYTTLTDAAFTSSGCIAACANSVIKLDPEGAISWVFEPPASWGSVHISGNVPAADECMVAYANQYDGGMPARLFKLDSTGDLVWERELPVLWFGLVTACEDGGYLISGGTGPEEEGDAFLIRTDENGWFGPVGVEPWPQATALTLEVSSNPASPQSVISLAGTPQGSTVSMAIYDMSGRVVSRAGWLSSGGGNEFSLAGLCPGLYLCRATCGSTVAVERFALLD